MAWTKYDVNFIIVYFGIFKIKNDLQKSICPNILLELFL